MATEVTVAANVTRVPRGTEHFRVSVPAPPGLQSIRLTNGSPPSYYMLSPYFCVPFVVMCVGSFLPVDASQQHGHAPLLGEAAVQEGERALVQTIRHALQR